MNMNDVKNKHPHFFSTSTMRFFNSRICGELIANRYFITSERFDMKSPRLYTAREVTSTGINTVGKFQQYSSARQARVAISKLVNGGIDQ